MPECPICQTPYEEGRRYCSQCSSYLLNPEEGNPLCPQCGIRVAAHQEVCHNCNAPLPGKTRGQPAVAPEEAPAGKTEGNGSGAPPWVPAPRSRVPAWVLASLVGAGVVIALLLVVIVLLTWKKGPGPQEATVTPTPPAEMKTAAPASQPPVEAPSSPGTATTTAPPASSAPLAPLASTPTSTATPAPGDRLEDQIKETLNNLKEAQLKGNIILFMSCYSYVFPTLDKKRKETLGNWDDFPFLSLDYNLESVKETGPESATARVTWTMQVQSRKTRKIHDYTQTFDVVFDKELGKWRIYSLKEIKRQEE